MEQLHFDMSDYEFSALFQWLVDNFGYSAWSKEDFDLYNSRWGWEGNCKDTTIFFKNKGDAVLFTLTWIN